MLNFTNTFEKNKLLSNMFIKSNWTKFNKNLHYCICVNGLWLDSDLFWENLNLYLLNDDNKP